MAAAGLWTTPSDLCRFAIEIQRACRGDPGRILSRDMARRMLTPVMERAGLGFFLDDEQGEVYFQHGGADEGFRAALVAHRDSGYGAAVMVNSNNGEIMGEVLRAVASVYGWAGYLPRVREPITLAAAELRKYAGTYLFHEDEAVRLRVEDGRLMVRTRQDEDFQLYPLSATDFVRAERSAPVKFTGASAAGYDSLLILEGTTTVAIRQSGEVILPHEVLERGDTTAACQAYREIRRRRPQSPAVQEERLNGLGYRYLALRKLDEAIAVFRLNVAFYPDSWNVYDSLGEGYLNRGDRELAIRYYRKSLELNPRNEGGKAALRLMEAKK
jgi:tetratricopeptide (TPR) repeat protein